MGYIPGSEARASPVIQAGPEFRPAQAVRRLNRAGEGVGPGGHGKGVSPCDQAKDNVFQVSGLPVSKYLDFLENYLVYGVVTRHISEARGQRSKNDAGKNREVPDKNN